MRGKIMRKRKRINRIIAFAMSLVMIGQTIVTNEIYVYGSEDQDSQETEVECQKDSESSQEPELIQDSVFNSEIQNTESVPTPTGDILETEDGILQGSTTLASNVYLGEDVTVEGDLILYDTLQLNGYTLTVNGTLILRYRANLLLDGELIINGNVLIDNGQILFYENTLFCQGDFVIEEMYFDQSILMKHEEDVLQIKGDFIFYQSIFGTLDFSCGKMILEGDFIELKENGSQEYKLIWENDFQLIMQGEDNQMIDIQKADLSNAVIILQGDEEKRLYVTDRELAQAINVEQGKVFPGVFRLNHKIWDLCEREYIRTFTYENVYLESGELEISNYACIEGNFIQNAPLTVSGNLYVYGDYRVQKLDISEGNLLYQETEGSIKLNNTSLYVYGDFVTASNVNHEMSDWRGYLYVQGDFYQMGRDISNFNPGENLQVYLIGSDQSIYFEDYERNWMPVTYGSSTLVELQSTVQFTNSVYGRFHGTAYVKPENYNKVGSYASITIQVPEDVCLTEDIRLTEADLVLHNNLNLNGHSLMCKSVTLSDYSKATLTMTQGETLDILGDFYVGSNSSSGELSNGTIKIGGNVTQKNTGTANNLVTSNQLLIQLCGNGCKQTVHFDSSDSMLETVEINNSNGGYVEIIMPVTIHNLINTSNSLLEESRGLEGYTLEKDETYEQDVTILGGDLDLNGHTLTIYGNLIIEGGSLKINEGSLIVKGDLRFQTSNIEEDTVTYEKSYAILEMNSEADRIYVEHDCYFETEKINSSVTKGCIEIGGNLYILKNTVSFGKDNELRLVGTEQQIIDVGTSSFNIGGLTIQNLEGIHYIGIVKANSIVSDSGCFKEGSLYLDTLKGANNYTGDLIVSKEVVLDENITIIGKIIFRKGVNLQSYQLQADEIECQGSTVIDSGKLICNRLTMQGSLQMKNDMGEVEVGDFILQQQTETSEMTEGTILIHGDFIENESAIPFITQKNCVVILEKSVINGENLSSIQFLNDKSYLEKLILRTNWNYYTSNRELNRIANQIISEYYDIEPPTVPQNLDANIVCSWSTTLKWEKATDNENQLAGYIIFRDGEEIGRTKSNSYQDNSCNHNTEYVYQVAAYDYHGNISDLSANLEVTTPLDTIAPNVPSKFVCSEYSEEKIEIQWSSCSTNDAIKEYRLYREGELLCIREEDGSSDYTYQDKTVQAGNTYSYAIEVVDKAYNSSIQKHIEITATTVPLAVQNLSVRSDRGDVIINWSDTQEYVAKYCIYRSTVSNMGYSEIAVIEKNESGQYEYLDQEVKDGTRYYYRVIPVISENQPEGNYVTKYIQTSKDTKAPSITKWEIYNLYDGNILNQNSGFWLDTEDNRGIADIKIYYQLEGEQEWQELSYKKYNNRNEKKKSVYGTIHTDFLRGTYIFKFVITDINGNTMTQTQTYYINCQGIEAPVITNTVVKDTSITLEWTTSDLTDAKCEVQLLENGRFVTKESVYEQTYYTLNGLYANQEYMVRVVPYTYDLITGNKIYGIPSEILTVTTKSDSTPPVIKSMTPNPTYIGDMLKINVTATDNDAIQKLELEYSLDKNEWIPIATVQAKTQAKNTILSYQFETSGLEEGTIYVRAYVYDFAGNKSQGVQNEYIIDHTPPERVTDLQTYDVDGKIGLRWSPISDCSYVVMRKDEKGIYVKLDTTTSSYYQDETAIYGREYQYMVYSMDIAGNYGAESNEVFGHIMEDVIAPKITQLTGEYGSTEEKAYIRCNVSDNIQLQDIIIEYEQDGAWNEIYKTTSDSKTRYIYYVWSTENCPEGVYQIRVTVYDINGFKTQKTIKLEIDRTAPDIQEMSVVDQGEYLSINWDIYEGSDFYYYYVYRVDENGKETRIYQTNVKDKNTVNDYPTPGVLNTYRLVIQDKSGNEQVIERVGRLKKTDFEPPKTYITYEGMVTDTITVVAGEKVLLSSEGTTDNIGIATVNWYINGEQISNARTIQHVFESEGEYEVALKATDVSANVAEAICKVSVQPAELETAKEKGRVQIQVVDENYVELRGAEIYYSAKNEGYSCISTDNDGKVSLELPVGEYNIVVYMDGYLPVEETICFENSTNKIKLIKLVKQEIVIGNMTVTEMTKEEILEHGIDINAAENRSNVKVELTYTYKRYDERGSVTEEKETITLYNNKPKTETYVSGGSSGGTHTRTTQNISTTNEPIIVIVDTQSVSWLKEMFRVDIQICNMAETPFDLSECEVHLNLPKGISLVNGVADNELDKQIGMIPAGETYETTWYIKGDEIGSYCLTADFYGILEPVGRVITATFQTGENVEVKSGEGLVLYVYPEKTAHIGNQLYIQYQLKNEGARTFYDVRTTFGSYQEAERSPIYVCGGQYMLSVVDYYAKTAKEASAIPVLYQGDTIHVTELKPGEAIYGTYMAEFGETVTEDGEHYSDIGTLYNLVDTQAKILEGSNTGIEVRVMPIQEHRTVIRYLGNNNHGGGNRTEEESKENHGTTSISTGIITVPEVEEEVADPIDVATGAYKCNTTALSLTGIEELSFQLNYDSCYTACSGEMGYGWSHNYEMQVEDLGGVIYLHKNASESLMFIREITADAPLQGNIEGSNITLEAEQGEVTYVSVEPRMIGVQLTRYTDGTYSLAIPGAETYQFDTEGRLNRIVSHVGNEITLVREENVLKITETATGSYLLITYGEGGFITCVSDSAGRSIAFQYDEAGNLIRRTNSNGDDLQYIYDAEHRIISCQDPYGSTYLVNEYDEQGRVCSQDDGDSATPEIRLQYTEQEDGTLKVEYTDRNGEQTISVVDSTGNILSQINENGDELICTYDEAGRVTEKRWEGNAIRYGYDALGQLISYTDVLGNTTTYVYDERGNCIEKSNSSGTTRYSYNNYNQKTSVTNPQGVTTTYTYNDAGCLIASSQGTRGSIQYTYEGNRLIGIQDREGNVAYTQYDSAGRLIQYTDGEGNRIFLAYDGVGNVKEIRMQGATDGNIITQTYTYDAVGNMLSYTDGNGNTTRYEYNIQDQLMVEIYPDGNRKECTRDGEGNIISIIYPETAQGSAMEQAVYDSAGNLTAVTDIYGYTTTYEYGAWGVLESITKPNGGRIQYEYYDNGLLKCQTDAEGNTITFTYDQYGNVTQISDALGVEYSIFYDTYGQITGLTDGCGNRMTFTYDSYGQIITSTDANGNTTTYTYDNNGNPIKSVDALGRITEYGYNGNGQIVQVRRYGENGTDFIQTQYTYDMLGNITSLTDGEDNTYQFAYDNNSNLISVEDAYGHTIKEMEYDCRNQLIRLTDASGTVTEQEYDAGGNLLSATTRSSAGTASVLYQYSSNGILSQVVDAAGNTSGITYDTEGNITSITNPNGGVTEYTYDLNNRVLSEKIGEEYQIAYTYDVRGQVITRENSRGQVTEYTYDGCGRLISQTDDLGTIVYTYDNSGNLLTVTDEAGTITRTYDQAGRMISYTDTSGNQIEYEYDAYDNVTAIHYPDGRTVTYSYNKNGKVTSVTDWSGRVTNYTYNKNSQLITTERPDGSIEDRTYDEAGQLIRICDRQGDKILHQYDYSYDGNGNITGIDTEGEAAGEHNYSALQNCTMEYDENNRLISYNGESVAYDADGNMTYGPLQGVMTEFRYDCRNRLIQAGDTTYIYDAENNRIGVETKDSSIRYVVDSQQELTRILQATETDTETGAETITCYTYGRGLIAQEKKTNDSDTEYRLYHFNHLGSTTLITNEQGKVIETFDYNPYGELLDGEIGEYLFLFNGEYGVVTDDNGLYYMRARYYNVDIKRFMNQDVIVGSVESSPSLNRYAYVEGNPVNYLDPFGLEKWEGEHDDLHKILGELSYSFAKIGVVSWFIPALIPFGYIGGLLSIWDSALHYEEIQHYDLDSKYYYSHSVSIGVNLISVIPYLGPVSYILYYWANKTEQFFFGKEIPDILADGYEYNKYLRKLGCDELPWYSFLFCPEFGPDKYGGRH